MPLAHGDVAQRGRRQSRIAFVERRLQVGSHIFSRVQVICCVPRRVLGVTMHPSRRFRARRLDLTMSRTWVTLVAAGQEYEHRVTRTHAVDPVARPMLYPQLRDSTSDRTRVAQIPE